MATRTRTTKRIEFLSYLLATAIENYGYGWFTVNEYMCEDGREAEWFAVIEETEEPGAPTYRVDLDTMAKGLGVIRSAIVATSDDGTYHYNAETFERLGFGGEERTELLLADRTNGDEGDYDVIGALAVLECALFGQVVYG